MSGYDFDALSVYGVQPQMPAAGIAAPTQHMATDDMRGGWRGLIDPRNPIMWFGVLVLVTIGAAGFAGSARVGKVSVGVAAGT